MTQQCSVATIFGGTRIGNRPFFMPENDLETFFNILTAYEVATIDTAQSYGNSEATLGEIKAGDVFTIDTKWSPTSWTEPIPPWATRDQIISSAEESIKRLGLDQV